jgi:4-amino-4-deoxy-L-arabinose transferase-like glycosyltransferase
MYNFLTFSDSAKYADIARNMVNGLGYGSSFSFWSVSVFEYIKAKLFLTLSTPPVMPFSMAGFFKIFGLTDFAVIFTSSFYFILTLIFVFLLSKKIWKSNLVGSLSVLVIGLNKDLINYAVSGASESPFIFEIVAASYFALIKRRWANFVTVLLLLLMYFTRPQAFIYIAGIILFWLLNNFNVKKAILYFVGVLFAGLLFDHFVLLRMEGKYFLYSVVSRGLHSSFNQTSVASDALRGATGSVGWGTVQIVKNIFYNLYNFFKLVPNIISPYLFAVFTIGLFIKSKNKIESSFKTSSVFMIVLTLLVVAASIPFFRYLHPVIPLIYIVAVGTMVEILKLQLSKRIFLVLGSCILVLIFGVGQTLGVLILDSRFERNTHNVGKPPVYIELSRVLKENTDVDDIIVTNLDTWGTWYGERKTVWFPLEPKQLIDSSTEKIPFDAIYLTSYLIDDQNYYMGNNWRLIFNNPNDFSKWTCSGCSEIAKEFKLKGVYSIAATSNYERQDAKAILLVKK